MSAIAPTPADITLVQSSFSAMIHAPIEKVDIPAGCFGLSESEYQSCSPAHVSAGATTATDAVVTSDEVVKAISFLETVAAEVP